MLQGYRTAGQGMGAPGDGKSGMGTNIPPGDVQQEGTGDNQTGHGVPWETGTARKGMGYPRGQQNRVWGVPGH